MVPNPDFTGVRDFLRTSSARKVILLLALACLPVQAAGSDLLEVAYTFARPSLETVKIDGQLFDRIIMPGAPNSGPIGHPALPAHGARILLPYGTDVVNVEIDPGDKILIGTGYHIEPVETPFVLSSFSDATRPLFVDSAVYALDSPVPVDACENVGVQSFRGYRVLVVKLHPVEYVPASGTLYYYRDMTVNVTTAPAGSPSPGLRNMAADLDEVATWIDNPSELATYPAALKRGDDGYDMLIIAPAVFVAAFQPLKDYHDSTGVATQIHTLDQIGGNDPQTIRDYIRQEYLNRGIQYVLIGGDDDVIPAHDIYVVAWDRPDTPVEYALPGDFYFSCLDGTFNFDNDALWGEPTDGDGGGDIDLFPDVHVGRFSGDSPQEITNLVSKTLAYLASQSPYLQKVLLAGEQLRFGGMGEYGGYAMDEMVDYSDAHGFLTYAFPADVYTIEKLYDVLAQPWNYWYASEMIARINSGFHIIDHLGHSGPGYAMRTDTSMLVQQLENMDYCFIYAEGCSAGQFDLTDCWGEYVTTKLPSGAFGCIANCRLGLGARSTAHPVHVFNREFWDAVYRADEAKPELGRALSDARADHIYHINDPGIRWTFYELTLFGDPAVAIKSVRGLVISFPDGLPERIPPDTEISVPVRAAGIGEGSPVPGSGQLHYAIDGGEVVTVAMADLAPGLYEATLPALSCDSDLEFYVSVQEGGGEKFSSPDSATPVTVSPVTDSVILFEDDFETDKGWVISGGLWERGIPAGQGGTELQYPVPDPTEGCQGPQVFGYNLNGDYENNLPEMYLTSPAVDCSGRDNVYLKFCRWLGVEQPVYDKARVQASNDGINWTNVWTNYAVIADLAWTPVEYDISAVAADQQAVFLRWVMGQTDGGLRYIGWNIDDVRLVSYDCTVILCGDANNDQQVNVADAVYIITYVFKSGPAPDPPEAGDANCDAQVNVADAVFLINYVFRGGPEACCP